MSGLGLELLRSEPVPEPGPETRGIGETFGQGLRSGTLSARGSLAELAGTGMGALGLDGTAMRQQSLRDQQAAADEGRGMVQLGDVKDVGSGLRWAAGAIGRSAPVSAAAVGAGVLTRGKSLMANIGAGTAAMMPFEAGEQIQRQRTDSVAAGLSDVEQLRGAALPALGSSVLQAAIPGVVAGKLAGKAGSAASHSLRTIGAHALADIPAEGLAEGGAEGVRQYGLNQINPNAGYDWDAIKNAALEGAALGGALGGVGAAGDVAHKYAGAAMAAPGRAIDAAKGLVPDSVKERAGVAVDKADEALRAGADMGGDILGDIPTALRKHYDAAKASGADWLERMANGQNNIDPTAPDQVAEQAKTDQGSFEWATKWASELADANLGPEKAEQLRQAATNLKDKANQQIVAGLKRGQDAVQDTLRAIDRFTRPAAKAGDVVGEATEVPDTPDAPRLTKMSKDYSGPREVIGRVVIDTLGEERLADLSTPVMVKGANGKTTRVVPLDQLAEGLRKYITQAAEGKAFSSMDRLDQLVALFDVAGDKTTAMLDAVHSAVRGVGKDDTAFFKSLNQIDAIQKGRQGVLETLQKNLRPELQRSTRARDLQTEMEMLSKWADDKAKEPGESEQVKFRDSQIRSALAYRYGDKVDLVLKAVEANRKAEKNMIDGEVKRMPDSDTDGIEKRVAGAVIGEDPTNKGGREGSTDELRKTRFNYFPQNGQFYSDPKLEEGSSMYGLEADKSRDPAVQRMATAKKENPNASVQFRKVSELDQADPKIKEMTAALRASLLDEADQNGLKGDAAKAWADKNMDHFGLVTAEQSKETTQFTKAEMDSVKLDSHYGKSPSRIDTHGPKTAENSHANGKRKDGNIALDAIRMTNLMLGRIIEAKDFDPVERTKAQLKVRAFMEAVAATQDQLGRSFEIPDSTVITHSGLTWGAGKKLMRGEGKSTPPVKADDGTVVPGSAKVEDQVARLTRQRDEIKAKIDKVGEREVERMKNAGVRLTKANVREVFARAREPFAEKLDALGLRIFNLEHENVGEDDAGRERADETGFEGEVERGIDTGKLTRAKETKPSLASGLLPEGIPKSTQSSAVAGTRARRLNEIRGELNALADKIDSGDATAVDRVAVTALKRERAILQDIKDNPLGSGRSEIDPFGPTHDVMRGGDNPDAVIKINADGSPRNDTVMRARAAPGVTYGAPRTVERMDGKTTTIARLPTINPGRKTNEVEGESAPISGNKPELGSPIVQAAKEMAKGSATAKSLSAKIFALVDHEGMSAKDEATLEAIAGLPTMSERAVEINKLFNKYNPEAATDADTGEPPPPDEYTLKEPPSPKVVAAKKAAFLTKARSGDADLIKSIESSTDPKGLQRAVDALANEKSEGAVRTIDAINDRLSELVQVPGVAYGMQTTKYSLMSAEIHAALERPGFFATHNSPIKHEGVFDWRSHAKTGEGQMVKGAGTYLSTSDVVHKYYKGMFRATVQSPRTAWHKAYRDAKANVQIQTDAIKRSEVLLTEHQALDPDAKNEWGARIGDLLESYKESIAGAKKKLAEAQQYVADHPQDALNDEPPTYHLSVDIKPEELMSWDRPLSEQSELVKKAAAKLIADYDIDSVAQTYTGIEAGMHLTGEDFYRELSQANGGSEAGDRAASDALQAAGILGHKMKASAKDGNQNPNFVIYDDSKIHTNYVHFDKSRVTPGAAGPINRQEVKDYFTRTLGPGIRTAWANILHAGEFSRTATGDVIRLSVHSMNPMSTAYHESLHAFFARLRDAKQGDITEVLQKAAGSANIMAQLREHLKNEPDALAQLNDPEEAAAYMYQFWAQNKLTVGPKVQNVFERIARFIRELTGLWTNDERAEQIMEYFHSGEYEQTRSDPNAVYRALMDTGMAGTVRKAAQFTRPLMELGETVASAGGARLRDTGIPALRELADAMKLKTTSEGQDPGYMPAARSERARMMNQLGKGLKPYNEATLVEATDAMQRGVKAQTLAARVVQKMIDRRLQDMLGYMKTAGVNITALGMKDGVPYFPRSWDASYISSHQRQFLAMVEPYYQSGQLDGDPRKLMEKLMVTDGAEFNVEVDKPGMQNAKKRVLTMITHADAAPFMRKDLYQILNSYVTQATRRAEWARRFGDDGVGIRKLLEEAQKQGATPAQLETAKGFVRAVDGTLGDTINPTARRLMGNMIVYQNIRLLPLAIFSSMVDPQGILVRGGTVSDAFSTFKRGFKEMHKNFQNDPQSDAATQLAEEIGTVDNAMLVHTLGASYSQGMVGDTGRAINDTFFRLNLMEQFNTSMRVGATQAALGFLERHAFQPGQHSTRYLRELGLDASDVKIGPTGRVAVLESDGLTQAQSAKMKAAVNRWVDGAVLRPDAVDKPVWMSDPHFALIAHLKQFIFSFHETILKRIVHETRNGNYTPAMALASYVPMMIAADFMKGIIQGGGEEPKWKQGWTASDYVWSGMERAGLFGVGQFGLDMLQSTQRGGDAIGSLMGPTVQQLTDGVAVLGGHKEFGAVALKALPANALYGGIVGGESTDPKFVD